MVSIIWSSLLAISLAKSLNFQCFNGMEKSRSQMEWLLEEKQICFLDNKYYISKDCIEGKCEALEDKLIFIKRDELFGAYGNPTFKLCKQLNGQAELVIIKYQGKERQVGKCTFKDNSYISTDYHFRKMITIDE